MSATLSDLFQETTMPTRTCRIYLTRYFLGPNFYNPLEIEGDKIVFPFFSMRCRW